VVGYEDLPEGFWDKALSAFKLMAEREAAREKTQ